MSRQKDVEKEMVELTETNHRLDQFEVRNIQETTTKLGEGAYAYVIEMKYRGLRCAGKKLHQFERSNTQYMLERFNKECEILASLKHPNIVQFLGIHFPENSILPTLVMEYMYDALSKRLEKHGRLPDEISYSILSDVATALCYLHGISPPVIHRDLTANNVLLSVNMQAKIGDLGVAKILDISAEEKMSTCPGCPAYMPPEVQKPNPKYGTEIDCFSYGVLTLHTFCGEWPIPDWVTRQDPQNSATLIALNEADRRQKYLSKLGQDHPLKQLVLECLNNNPTKRPNADSIQKRVCVVATRFPPLFENSLQILQENEKLMKKIVELNQQLTSVLMERQPLDEEDQTTKHDHLISEIERLQSLLNEGDTKSKYEMNQLRGDIKSMNTQLVELVSKLDSSEKQQSLQGATLTKVEEALVVKTKQLITASEELKVKQCQLENKEKQLSNLSKTHEAQQKELVAKSQEQEHKIEELEALKKEFDNLCDQSKAKEMQLEAKQEQLAAVSKQLEASKKQVKLKQEELKMTAEELKHARTKEDEVLQELACKEELIKISKADLDHIKLEKLPMLESQIQMKENSIKILSSQLEEATDYIYNKRKKEPWKCPLQFQFQKCADLPIAMSNPQCAVVNGTVYAGGGVTDDRAGVAGQGQVFEYDQIQDIWNTLPDCPTRLFGLVQFCNNLLLLGGVTETAVLSGTVYKYNKATRSWESDALPPMINKRFQMTVFSHGTMLAVCGGITQGRNPTDAVEVFVNGKWQTGPSLPHRCFLSKPVIIGDKCYLMGGLVGITPAEVPTKVVLTAKLSDLFTLDNKDAMKRNAWEIHSTEICQITQYKSTPCNYGGLLLALGGWDCALLCPSADFIVYSSKKGFWEKTADLPMARSSSTATAQLPTGQVMIIGGIEKNNTATSIKRSASVLSMSLSF